MGRLSVLETGTHRKRETASCLQHETPSDILRFCPPPVLCAKDRPAVALHPVVDDVAFVYIYTAH